ncbi:Efflux pump rdc3, partial [Fusarium oxysporum f. sp. albedinis]
MREIKSKDKLATNWPPVVLDLRDWGKNKSWSPKESPPNKGIKSIVSTMKIRGTESNRKVPSILHPHLPPV